MTVVNHKGENDSSMVSPEFHVSVLIPVYNSERTIGRLCRELVALLTADFRLEIVLVNDGSSDRSTEVCQELAANYPEIISYIELTRNFGEHNAVITGLRYVSGEFCVIMDDDFQNSPQDVRKLIAEISKGYDAVYTYSGEILYPFFRRFGSKINDKMANLIINKPPGLYLSSFKIINRILIDEIVKYENSRPYIDGIILRTTCLISAVPVEHHKRENGRSGYTLRKLITLWGSMMLNFSMAPIRIIGVFGLLVSLAAVVYFIYSFFLDQTVGYLSEHETVMTVVTFFFGLLLLCMAVLAEYIGRIYLLQNNEPQSVVRKSILCCKRPLKKEQIRCLPST